METERQEIERENAKIDANLSLGSLGIGALYGSQNLEAIQNYVAGASDSNFFALGVTGALVGLGVAFAGSATKRYISSR